MKMPDKIEDIMLAPCGMNCSVCYKHVGMRKQGKPCEGCLKGDLGKPVHCRTCKIKNCAKEKGHVHCFECAGFPCKLMENLEKAIPKYITQALLKTAERRRKEVSLRFWSKIARSGLALNVAELFLYMIVLVASVAMQNTKGLS